jgi:hypothetical protein
MDKLVRIFIPKLSQKLWLGTLSSFANIDETVFFWLNDLK